MKELSSHATKAMMLAKIVATTDLQSEDVRRAYPELATSGPQAMVHE